MKRRMRKRNAPRCAPGRTVRNDSCQSQFVCLIETFVKTHGGPTLQSRISNQLRSPSSQPRRPRYHDGFHKDVGGRGARLRTRGGLVRGDVGGKRLLLERVKGRTDGIMRILPKYVQGHVTESEVGRSYDVDVDVDVDADFVPCISVIPLPIDAEVPLDRRVDGASEGEGVLCTQ